MQKFLNFINKNIFIYVKVLFIIIISNILIYAAGFYHTVTLYNNEISPSKMLSEVSSSLECENGIYMLKNEKVINKLKENNIWAFVLKNDGNVIWNFDIPENVPLNYTLKDMVIFSKWYIDDYPVFSQIINEDILILGYPEESYTKFSSNYMPKSAITKIPVVIGLMLVLDIIIISLFYHFSKQKIIKEVSPIINGINDLSKGKEVNLQIKGELSEIGSCLNKTSLLLKKQNHARANWISGISHDIRTPLTTIIGYSYNISRTEVLDSSLRKKAEIIENEGNKIKNLIMDLNLVSQLQYNIQLFNTEKIYLARLLREIAAEYINNDLNNKYNFVLEISPETETEYIHGDIRLITRAFNNLVSNSINHNPEGCLVKLKLNKKNNKLFLAVEDDGIGISKETLKRLNNTPHYLESVDERLDLRHGLGLLLVREIINIHKGTFTIDGEQNKGFKAVIIFNK